MKVYKSSHIRSVALIGHQSAGKTTLTESLLYSTGVINRMGDIAQGNTVSDYDEEEQRRGLSLGTSVIPVEFQDLKINFLDTPGYTDFQGDVKNALRVSDLALVVVDAATGVQVGTEVYWGFASEVSLPRMVLLNKMNRDNARSPEQLLGEMETIFSERFVPLQVPIGSKDDFEGVVDLIRMRAIVDGEETGIPAEMADIVEEARMTLMEAAAEADDELLEAYFDVGELNDGQIIQGIKAALLNGTFVPVMYLAADESIGIQAFLSQLCMVAPSPENRTYETEGAVDSITVTDDGPLVVYVFKTHADPYVGSMTYFRLLSGVLKGDSRYVNFNKDEEERFGTLEVPRGAENIGVDEMHAGDIGAVAKLSETVPGDTLGKADAVVTLSSLDFPQPIYAVAITPVSQADASKMGSTLTRLADEDQTLFWRQEHSTNETILEGMGDVHIDVAIRRAAHLGTNLQAAIPKIPYRETISRTGTARYRHKKQSGGAGQFAEVHLRVEPLGTDEGFMFDSEVFGGAISHTFIPSIEKGIKQVMDKGVIAGYPVVDVKAVVFDGKEHPVDSKDIAFQIAGRQAFKQAMREGSAVLLEPVMRLTVTVPEGDMGSVISDLSSRRGQVAGTDILAGKAIITGLVPLAEIQRYSNDLRSFTQGRGVYTVELERYDKVPSNIADDIIADASLVEDEE